MLNEEILDEQRTALREKLAAYGHDEAWAGWMQYMLSLCATNEDGTMTIPADKVDRWTYQMNTDYADLPESMKPSDREQADHILAIIDRKGCVSPVTRRSG